MITGALKWEGGELVIIDQTQLPGRLINTTLHSLEDVWEAIKALRVRGAPAIGVCAAFGVLVGIREQNPRTVEEMADVARAAADYLATARPTAVNLFNVLNRMREVVAEEENMTPSPEAFFDRLEQEAMAIFEEDVRTCHAIGEHGVSLIQDGMGILTHCNAGALATAGYGTALAPMFCAHEEGRVFHVFADETRPLLQGARLTAWELMNAGIDVTLICDNMAAQVMREGRVQLVMVGADRITANGDAANKIGTYGVAVLAKAHNIPFYVAAPLSTFDCLLASGDAIPIEQRDPAEVTHGFGVQTAPEGIYVYNPSFDVTPADLISGIVTEVGILRPPYTESIALAFRNVATRV